MSFQEQGGTWVRMFFFLFFFFNINEMYGISIICPYLKTKVFFLELKLLEKPQQKFCLDLFSQVGELIIFL